MSVDTKRARELAKQIRMQPWSPTMQQCENVTLELLELADEVEWLRKEVNRHMHIDVWFKGVDSQAHINDLLKSRGEPTKLKTVLMAAKAVMYGDSDSSAPYKVLRDAIRAYEEDEP